MMKLLILTTILLIGTKYAFSQSVQDIRLTDRLVYHFPFDGDLTNLVLKNTSPLTYDGSSSKIFARGHLKYQNDQFVQLSKQGLTHIGIREELDKQDSTRTYGFWFQSEALKEKPDSLTDTHQTIAVVRLFDSDSLKLRLTGRERNMLLVLDKDTTVDTLCTLSIGKWYYIRIKTSFVPSQPDFVFDLFELVSGTIKPTLEKVNFTDRKVGLFESMKNYMVQEMKCEKKRTVTLGFYPNDYQIININDFRIYERELEKEDMNYLVQFTINDGKEDLKFQLALIYKKLADEYYMANDRKNALTFYNKAEIFTNSETDKKIIVTKMSGSEVLNNQYYILLKKDIAYRKLLLEAGHSFWGVEFSTSPMFPTNEISMFLSAFEDFTTTYFNIGRLQLIKDEITEDGLKISINQSKDRYNHEIDLQKKQIADVNLGFYNAQINTLKDRLNSIEEEQELLTSRSKRYEQELKKNEEKIVSALTKAVSECAIGVRIENIPDLSGNFKKIAFSILDVNPEIKTTLLGSANDLINTAQASYDYYNKAKQGLNAVKATLNKNNYPEQIIGLGDAVLEMGFLDEKTSNEWKQIKRNYKNIDELKTRATSIVDVAMSMKNGNFESWTRLTDFVAKSGYFPEYQKAFTNYVDFPKAAYEAYQAKKYDSLLKLGTIILDTITHNPNSRYYRQFKREIDDIPSRYNQLKPLFTAIQKSGNDSIIKNTLFETIFDPNVIQYFRSYTHINAFVWRNMQTLISDNSNPQVLQSVFSLMCTEAPNMFVLILPPRAKYRMREIFNVNSDNDLIANVRAFSGRWEITKDSRLRLPFGNDYELFIRGDTLTFGSMSYKLFFDPSKLSQAGNVLLMARKLVKDDSIKDFWTKRLFASDFATLMQDENLQLPSVNPKRKQDIYDVFEKRLITNGYRSKADIIQNEAYKLALGTIVMENFQKTKSAQKILYQDIPTMNIENLYLNETESIGLQKERAMRDMASRAVDMAFPGIGTALKGVMDVLEGIFDNSDIVNQLRDIYKRKVELRSEMLGRLEQLQSARSNSQIAAYEYEIAKINMELSGKKHEEYSQMLKNTNSDRRFKVRRKIDMQLPIFYYYAERLRYYYQRLNKASSFWFGSENTLENLLYNDNSNIRLALDESIKLFDWVKAPDISSSRQDIDSLYNFWNRHAVLVKNYRNELQKGLRSSGRTEVRKMVIELSRDFPERWKKFNTWKASASTLSNPPETFEVDLTEPLSYYNRWGLNENFTSLKIINVSFTAIGEDGNKIDLPVEVRHPGVSFSESGDLQVLREIEPLTATEEELKVMGGKADLDQPNLIRALTTRWYTSSDYIPGHFEGYNLRSQWKVKFRPSANTPNMKKFYIVFTIQSTSRPDVVKSNQQRYPYWVNIKRSNSSAPESYSIICTKNEASRYERAINNAINTRAIQKGSINLIQNGNTIEVYSSNN